MESDNPALAARDRDWVTRITSGDLAAFEAMFRTYADGLCGFVYTYLQSAPDAQEVVQDLFLWIWQHRHEWEVTTTLRIYLFHSARNRAINHLRRRRVEHRFLEEALRQPTPTLAGAPPQEADERAHASDLANAFDAAVAQLPARCRQVFLLNRQEQLSYTQIAELLGISPKTVEIHMGRALATLRKQLAPWKR